MPDAIGNIAKDLAFSQDEYAERCRRLRALMPEAGIDAMLVHQPPSVFYFSGYENLHVYDSECVIIPQDGPVGLLVPHADLARAQLTAWIEPALTFLPGAEPVAILSQRLVEQGLSRARIGVEKRVARAAGLSVHVFEALRAALPQARFWRSASSRVSAYAIAVSSHRASACSRFAACRARPAWFLAEPASRSSAP